MSYWKGLMLAAAIDLVWIAGCPLLVTEPELNPETAVSYVETPVTDVEQINEVGNLEDSLMVHLKDHPEDVTAMEKIAHVYMEQGWYDAAIRPLARALELDTSRRSLWALLDEAIEKSGRGTISDAELVQAAKAFVEAVEMWGEGC
jgi:cytochrome c-type biogenesis protein CcmH/NrfG